MKYTVAAAQYPLDLLESWDAYEAKLSRWVSQAAEGGASLAVFPEYGAMELASLDPTTMGDLDGSLATVADHADRAHALHAALAARHGLHILAASLPIRVGGGYRNAARLFTPGGSVGVQEKLVMTRFEREDWDVAGGGPLRLFDTALGRIGVLICYDAEFPLNGRALAEAGAELILVPSCTYTVAGYNRVRIGAMARALESQCYVVHSPTVAEARWCPAIDDNHGAAAIYGPPDKGFPETGVVAQGELDAVQWVFGEVDLAKVAVVRADGEVLNLRDWRDQPGAAPLPPVEVVSLR